MLALGGRALSEGVREFAASAEFDERAPLAPSPNASITPRKSKGRFDC